jgi:hypothetical protein
VPLLLLLQANWDVCAEAINCFLGSLLIQPDVHQLCLDVCAFEHGNCPTARACRGADAQRAVTTHLEAKLDHLQLLKLLQQSCRHCMKQLTGHVAQPGGLHSRCFDALGQASACHANCRVLQKKRSRSELWMPR